MTSMTKDVLNGVIARNGAPGTEYDDNDWNGVDFPVLDGIVRLAAEDTEAGVEVYRITENGCLLWSARFDGYAPVAAIAAMIAAEL